MAIIDKLEEIEENCMKGHDVLNKIIRMCRFVRAGEMFDGIDLTPENKQAILALFNVEVTKIQQLANYLNNVGS